MTTPMSITEALEIPEEKLQSRTGIYTLENGGKSLSARLWLFDHAQKSIDVQYYSFSNDVTGLIACERIIRAADRGVKVRILIDDAASRMNTAEIRMIDSHENIEVRVYNAGLKLGRLDRRLKRLAKNSNRLLRRMHNKTVNIDGQFCITGGRNVADEYFDYHKRYNFRDRDVLLAGKEVRKVTRSYNAFWNDSLTVPFSKLSGKGQKKKYRDPSRFDRLYRYAAETKEFLPESRERIKSFPEELKAAEKTNGFFWITEVSFISDIPGKNENRKDREGGVCTDTLIRLLKEARSTVDMQSPYFITSDESRPLIKETIQRGVKVRLLTNSLGSTDNDIAFSGYQKSRQYILDSGVDIYEFKPDPKVRFELMVPEKQKLVNFAPPYGLHSKTLVIDKYITVIGSYNFDPRSANYNTECIVVIRSAEVAKHLEKYIEEEFRPENAWKISKEFNADSKAGIRKRVKAALRWILPRKIL